MIRAPKVQHSLAKIFGEMPDEGLSTAEILAKIRKEYKDDIESDRIDLEGIGIIHLIGQRYSKSTNATPNFDPNLFGEYDVPHMLYVRTGAGRNRVMKQISHITCEEAQLHSVKLTKLITKKNPANNEFVRLAADMKASGAKPDETIGDWWASRNRQKK
jgi:hypothetical protein